MAKKPIVRVWDELIISKRQELLELMELNTIWADAVWKDLPASVRVVIQQKMDKYWRMVNPKNLAKFCSERKKAPSYFDSRSFRTTKKGKHRLTFGCPKGKWDNKKQVCRVPVVLQRILHPEGEKVCPVGGKEAKMNPKDRHSKLAAFIHKSLFFRAHVRKVDDFKIPGRLIGFGTTPKKAVEDALEGTVWEGKKNLKTEAAIEKVSKAHLQKLLQKLEDKK